MMKHRIPALLLAALLMSTVLSMPVSASEGNTGFAARLEQEKVYLLEALDRLEELGLSPIAIWSKITNDESVPELIGTVSETAQEALSGAVSGLGESLEDSAVSEAGSELTEGLAEEISDTVNEVVEEQTEQIKQGIAERIREWINGFLDDL